MKYKPGDKVTYIGNVAFDDREDLFNNVIGVVTGYHYPRGSVWADVVMCDWVTSSGYKFQWNVPESYTKRLRL
jgi:hypothetical protein